MLCPGFPGGSEVKVSAWNAGDPGSIPGLGRYLGEGNGNPLQQLCLENPMEGGAWWATIHGVAESDTTERLHFHFQCYALYFPGGSDGKESTCQCRRPGFSPWVGKIPWRREWQPTPIFLPREFHGL